MNSLLAKIIIKCNLNSKNIKIINKKKTLTGSLDDVNIFIILSIKLVLIDLLNSLLARL